MCHNMKCVSASLKNVQQPHSYGFCFRVGRWGGGGVGGGVGALMRCSALWVQLQGM